MRGEEEMAMERTDRPRDAASWIGDEIKRFTASGDNSLQLDPPEPAWDEPLVGFARGGDPLFAKFKEETGAFFWTPEEIFALTFPDSKAAPEELTVISWILPQTERTRRDHRREKALPSERWARSRKFGEDFNMKLRGHVVGFLGKAGCEAVAPMLSPLWKLEKSDRYGFASSWSERHAAYAAGLGTFGLCDGLITPRGKAMRCGSVVARISVPPSERPYDDPYAYCLFYIDGSCGKCIKRCPADAISREGGHDKEKCKRYLDDVASKSVRDRFGIEIDACGLCQTGVPCEARIPVPGQAV
ncbi:MAG: epoxyqueuosine reductase [Deltaproteobacteria bacterium]|nr:epoxyqueuosine reductase [Deltaproteobacteria bacterium]